MITPTTPPTDSAPPPTDSTPPPAAPPAAPPTPTNPWDPATLAPEKRGWLESAGFKGLDTLIDDNQGLKSFLGVPKDQLMRRPKDGDAEGWKAFWKQLGAPDDPAAYGLTPPEGGDGTYHAAVAKFFQERGLPVELGKAFGEFHNQFLTQAVTAAQAAETAQESEQMAALKAEWGSNYTVNEFLAKQAMARFFVGKDGSVDEAAIERLKSQAGYAATLKGMYSIGKTFAEAPLRGGDQGAGVGSVEAAMYEMQEMTKPGGQTWALLQAKDPATVARYNALNRKIGGAL